MEVLTKDVLTELHFPSTCDHEAAQEEIEKLLTWPKFILLRALEGTPCKERFKRGIVGYMPPHLSCRSESSNY